MRKLKSIPQEFKSEALEQWDYLVDDDALSKEGLKYASSIGELLIAFSYLESNLNALVAETITERAHDPGYRILKYLKFQQKVDLTRDHYSLMISYSSNRRVKEKYKKWLKSIYEKLSELGQIRNKVAHANWQTLDKDGYVRVKIDDSADEGGIFFKKMKLTPAILFKYTRQCYAMSVQVDSFRDEVMGGLWRSQ